METKLFGKLLLKTAFCCMASDGDIDVREVALIKSICEKSPLFIDFNIQMEINYLVKSINEDGKEFISQYFELLNTSSLSQTEELSLIDVAIQTIKADDVIEYSEIKFFKNIRYRLKVSDEDILAVFPDIEQYLEQDLITKSFISKITNQYLDTVEFPEFDFINTGSNSLDGLTKDK